MAPGGQSGGPFNNKRKLGVAFSLPVYDEEGKEIEYPIQEMVDFLGKVCNEFLLKFRDHKSQIVA